MLVPLTLLVAQLPQPTASLPLVGSQGDDDRPYTLHFTPDSRRLVVHNGFESGRSSITEIDLVQGRAVSRSDDFEECHSFAVSPSGSIALVPEEYSGNVQVLGLPGLQLLGTVARSPHFGNDHLFAAVDRAGSRALLVEDFGDRAWVLDLATMTQERHLTLPQYVSRANLAVDGVSVPFADGQDVYTFDITTGLESTRRPLTAPGIVTGYAMSGDGAVCVVFAHDSVAGTSYVERFSLPGLTSLGSATLSIPIPGGAGTAELRADEQGLRVLHRVSGSIVAIDTLNGNVVTVQGSAWHAAIDPTGQRVVTSTGAALLVSDAGTGQVLAQFGARGEDRRIQRIAVSPNGRMAAVTRELSDRVEVFDIGSMTPARLLDVSSGYMEEADGPFLVALTPEGDRALVVGRDSDDLRVIDVEGGPTLLGRVLLGREPRALGVRSDGRALVAHGRGAALSVVDVSGPTEIARHPLPGPALAMQPDVQGAAAWVLVEGEASRSLEHVDTNTGLVLASVALPGGAGTNVRSEEVLPAVLFDPVRSRAFVSSPDTGELVLVDLATAAIVDVAPVTTFDDLPALSLSEDGSSLYHQSTLDEVTAFDVTAAGLAVRWTWACGAPAAASGRRIANVLYDAGSHLLVTSRCSANWTVLDTSSGAATGTLAYSPDVSFLRAFDDEVWIDFGAHAIVRFRGVGGQLSSVGVEGSTSCCGDIAFHHPLGRVVGVSEERTYYPDDRFLVLDLVQDTEQCTPTTFNSIGLYAGLEVDGRGWAGAPLVVTVDGLQPGAMVGYLLAGSAATPPTPLGAGVGELCLGGGLARFVHQVQAADASGRQRFVVDTRAVPVGSGPVAITPGATWVFQSWYRDALPGGSATSNTSTARAVRFD